MELQDFLYVASHADVEADGIPTPAFANDRASKKRLTSAAIIEVLEAAEGKWGRAVAAAKAATATAEKPPGKQKSAAPLCAAPSTRREASTIGASIIFMASTRHWVTWASSTIHRSLAQSSAHPHRVGRAFRRA